MSDKRVRSWATVLYPESAKDNWLEILGEQCVPCFVSPLHNLDVNADGEIKKEHFHILFVFVDISIKKLLNQNFLNSNRA